MATPNAKCVFVVYGRNVAAYREMKKFLACIGATEKSFDQVANAQASPYVTEVVIRGIQLADAVIVLFTPDELAVLHESSGIAGDVSGSFKESRWQARPNVIFEAGIAFGLKKDKTILVAVGKDVAGFSDIGGVHIVHLDNDASKVSLRDRLQILLRDLPGVAPDWHRSVDSGDFEACTTKRWPFYDELESLESFLTAKSLILERGGKGKKRAMSPTMDQQGNGPYSLLQIIRLIVTIEPKNWVHVEPREFIESVKARFDDEVADSAYWWLCVAGFFQFQDIDHWFDGDASWKYSVDYVKFSARALALIQKLRATSASSTGVSR